MFILRVPIRATFGEFVQNLVDLLSNLLLDSLCTCAGTTKSRAICERTLISIVYIIHTATTAYDTRTLDTAEVTGLRYVVQCSMYPVHGIIEKKKKL